MKWGCFIVLFIFITGIIGGISRCSADATDESLYIEKYKDYQKEFINGRPIYELKKTYLAAYKPKDKNAARLGNKVFMLKDGHSLYYLDLSGWSNGDYSGAEAAFTLDPENAWQDGKQFKARLDTIFLESGKSEPRVYYGTFDLEPDTGIKAKMNILSADKNMVKFTIDYY